MNRSGSPSVARVIAREYRGTGTGSGIVNTGLAFAARTASATKSVAVHTSSTTSKAGVHRVGKLLALPRTSSRPCAGRRRSPGRHRRANRGVLSAFTHRHVDVVGRPSGCALAEGVGLPAQRRVVGRRRKGHAGGFDRARELARGLADAELGAEIPGDVEALAQALRSAAGQGRTVRRARGREEARRESLPAWRRRSRSSRRSASASAPKMSGKCICKSDAVAVVASRGNATRAVDRPRPANSARRGTRRDPRRQTGRAAPGTGPVPRHISARSIQAPHPRRDRHARGQRAPAVRRPAARSWIPAASRLARYSLAESARAPAARSGARAAARPGACSAARACASRSR